MTIKGKISDLIHPKKEFKQLLRASETARARKKENLLQSHIGHILAVSFYDENDEWIETAFIDHIDICRTFTVICFDKDCAEWLYWKLDYISFVENRLKVYYQNKTSIEITRIT